jgi:hypothetical protein
VVRGAEFAEHPLVKRGGRLLTAGPCYQGLDSAVELVLGAAGRTVLEMSADPSAVARVHLVVNEEVKPIE